MVENITGLTEEELLHSLPIADYFNNIKSYNTMALEEASKLPNKSVQELLQNADKIYHWLLKNQ